MSEPFDEEQGLEQLLDRTLRELPLRPAPPSLEARVFAELRRRAALPWWRRSFAYWPLFARAGFVATCMALVGLAFLQGAWAVARLTALSPSGAPSMFWARQALAALAGAAKLAALIVGAVPPAWLYAGIAVSAALYAALFGLGAAAYRTLYLNPTFSGDL
jgi:hypothetical protein